MTIKIANGVYSYFKFLFKSTNQHGVHSPYVYNYLTKGLYQNRKKYQKESSKSIKLILSTISYFDFKTISTTNPEIERNIKNHFPNISINKHHELFDLIIMEKLQDYTKYLNKMHNNSLLIVVNTQNQSKEIILNQNDCTLVLNFHHTIVLSKRKEQKRENFFLRY